MKKLFMALAVLVALAAPNQSFAQSVDPATMLEGLTEQQAAKLALDAANMKAAPFGGRSTTPDDVLKYANIGAGVGKALAGTARELGVEVNNFAKTDVGKLSVFLIVWHLFGGMAVHIIVGVGFFVTAVPIWLWSYRNHSIKRLISIREDTDENGKKTKVTNYDSTLDPKGEAAVAHWLIFAVVIILSLAITFSW